MGKKNSELFFKANLLTQWTRAVQLASYTTGKRLIVKNARQLANNQTDLGRKLTDSNKKYLVQQLNDLNIDADEAISFYKSSLKNGQYDIALAKQNDFYEDKLVKGAARFTREVILNPSSAQANRPLWFSHPAAQILIQFAGYPTVFNNTILKRFFNESINSPLQVMPKVVPTVLLMTSVAHLGNTIRSNGANLKDYETGNYKSEGELLGEAIRRWGGYGPFDYASRWNNEYDRNVGGFTATAKAFAGPLPQDAIDAILYRKGLAEVAATNLPGYGAYDILFGEGTKKEIRRIARGSAPDGLTAAQTRRIGTYAKGGIVKNVPNVIDEPDERVDRMTGVPYDEQAGAVMEDEEERTGFKKGGFLGKGGFLFDYTNPLDYLMFIPGIGALGIAGKALNTASKLNKARKLPKTQYHGGYSNVEKGQGNITGFYSTPDVSYANVFANPKRRVEKGRGTPELYKLDLSSAKNIELTDKPSKKLAKSIDAKIKELNSKDYATLTNDEKEFKASLGLMFKTKGTVKRSEEIGLPKRREVGESGVRGYQISITNPLMLDFLRKQGVEILTDSKTLRRGARGTGTDAEYYLLKDFPKIRLTKEDKEELVRLGQIYVKYNEGGIVTESNLNNFIELALQINNEKEYGI